MIDHQSCAHPFFDELRTPTTVMPDGSILSSDLFNFTVEELGFASPESLSVLFPNANADVKQLVPLSEVHINTEGPSAVSVN